MRVILSILKGLIVIAWAAVAIFVTASLLSYNEFNITQMGRTTFLIIHDDELEPDFKPGDLVIVTRASDRNINVGDSVFFYNGNKANEFLINVGTVTGKEELSITETTYEINGRDFSGSNVIGQVEGATVIHTAGTVLAIFQSRWGFMLFVIFPTLFALVYEVVRIVEEARKTRREA